MYLIIAINHCSEHFLENCMPVTCVRFLIAMRRKKRELNLQIHQEQILSIWQHTSSPSSSHSALPKMAYFSLAINRYGSMRFEDSF